MKSKKGFTLVELLISVAIASVIILSAGIVLVGGHTMWNRGLQRANLQRDASLAILRINRAIREGESAVLEDNGNTLKILKGTSWIKYYDNGNNLIFEVQGRDPVAIIENNLNDLEFQVQPKIIKVTLSLLEDEYQIDYISTVMMRNFEG